MFGEYCMNMSDQEEKCDIHGYPDMHLNIPIKDQKYEDLIENLAKLSRENKIKFDSRSKISTRILQKKTMDPHKFCGYICKLIMSDSLNFIDYQDQDLAYLDAYENFITELSQIDLFNIPNLNLISVKYTLINNKLWRNLVYFRSLFLNVNLKTAKNLQASSVHKTPHLRYLYGNYYETDSDKIKITIIHDAILISIINYSTVLNRDFTLMIGDIISERTNIIQCCLLNDKILNYKWYPSIDQIQNLLYNFDQSLFLFGNISYTVIKSWESLIIGELLSRENTNIQKIYNYKDNNIKSIQNVITESNCLTIIEKEKFNNIISNLIYKIEQIKDVTHLSQMFGLYRIWGHPIINSAEGSKKVKLLGTKEKVLCPITINKVLCSVKEMIIINYYKKHNKYPKLKYDLKQLNPLTFKIHHNKEVNTLDPLYNLMLWNSVQGDKTFDIPTIIDLNLLMSDKSLSPNRSMLRKNFFKKNNNIKNEDKRVVITWLKENFPTIDEFLYSIDKDGIPDDELIIGLSPKEKEIKPVARMFAVTSMKIRSYVVITEDMIARNLLPLIPDITMKDNFQELAEKMIRYTSTDMKIGNKNPRKRSKDFFMSIDFEKWNTNMRNDLVYEPFKFIDNLFGFDNLISRTHEIFSNSLIYTSDQHYLPSWQADNKLPILNDYTWSGHLGGFEGLRQKGWTIVTVAAIKLVSSEVKIPIKIMGQGDNQILKINIKLDNINEKYEDKYCEVELERFRKRLDEVFTYLGLPIKLEETWLSSSLFSYGKFLIYKGSCLPTSLKRASTFRPYSSENIPTLDNCISTISANGMSMCMNDLNSSMSILSTYLEMSYCYSCHLSNSLIFGKGLAMINIEKLTSSMITNVHLKDIKNNQKKSTLIKILLIYGGVFGGYPVLCPLHFIIRGFPDPVTEWLTFYNLILKNIKTPVTRSVISNIINIQIEKPKDYYGLFLEPLSLHIHNNIRPEGVFKGICKNYLVKARWIKNRYFIDFINHDSKGKEELVLVLSEMAPLDVRLGHEILSATIWGYMEGVISKVRSTSTLQLLAIKNSTKSPLTEMKNAEKVCYQNVIKRCLISSASLMDIDNFCSRKVAQLLRERSWNKTDIIGVTVPHPAEIVIKYNVGYNVCTRCLTDDKNYILTIGSDFISQNKELAYLVDGPYLPYLGSITKEKIQSSVEKLPTNPDPLTIKAVELQRVIGWFINKDNRIADIIKGTLRSITDAEPSLFQSQQTTVTGSEDHRFKDSSTKRGAYPSYLYNFLTHVYSYTTTLSSYSKGSKNVNLHFQALICFCQYFAIKDYVETNRSNSDMNKLRYHFHLNCKDCICEVNTIESQIPEQIEIPQLPNCNHNNLLWVDKGKLIKSHINPVGNNTNVMQDEEIALRCQLIFNNMVAKIFADIILSNIYVTEKDIKLRDRMPLTWSYKLDPVFLIKRSCKLIISGLFYNRISRAFNSRFIDLNVRSHMINQFFSDLNPKLFSYLSPLCEVVENLHLLKSYYASINIPKFCNKNLSVSCSYLKLIFIETSFSHVDLLPTRINDIIIPSRKKGTSDIWEIAFDKFASSHEFHDILILNLFKTFIVTIPSNDDRILLNPGNLVHYIKDVMINDEKGVVDSTILTNWLKTIPDFKFLNASPDFVSKMIQSNRYILDYQIISKIHNDICDVLRIISTISSRYKITILNVELDLSNGLIDDIPNPCNIMINCINERRLWDIPHLCILDTSRILTWVPILDYIDTNSFDYFLILGDGLGYISLYLTLITDNPNIIPFNYIDENDLNDEALSNDWNVYNSKPENHQIQQIKSEDGLPEERIVKENYKKQENQVKILKRLLTECNLNIELNPLIFVNILSGLIKNSLLICDITFDQKSNTLNIWKKYIKLCVYLLNDMVTMVIMNLTNLSNQLICIICHFISSLDLLVDYFKHPIGSRLNNNVLLILRKSKTYKIKNLIDSKLEELFQASLKNYTDIQFFDKITGKRTSFPLVPPIIDNKIAIKILKEINFHLPDFKSKYVSMINSYHSNSLKIMMSYKLFRDPISKICRINFNIINSIAIPSLNLRTVRSAKWYLNKLGTKKILGLCMTELSLFINLFKFDLDNIEKIIFESEITLLWNINIKKCYLTFISSVEHHKDIHKIILNLKDVLDSRSISVLKELILYHVLLIDIDINDVFHMRDYIKDILLLLGDTNQHLKVMNELNDLN